MMVKGCLDGDDDGGNRVERMVGGRAELGWNEGGVRARGQ